MTIWPAGNASDILKDKLIAFSQVWSGTADYVNRLPYEHIHYVKQGERQGAGIHVIFVTEPDEAAAQTYTAKADSDYPGEGVMVEEHKIAVIIKADKHSGGAASVTSMHSLLRSLYLCKYNTPERDDLIANGIYNLFESNLGLEVISDDDAEEGEMYSQQINLVCNTETLIK